MSVATGRRARALALITVVGFDLTLLELSRPVPPKCVGLDDPATSGEDEPP